MSTAPGSVVAPADGPMTEEGRDMSEPVLSTAASDAAPTSVAALPSHDAPTADDTPTTGDAAVDEALRTLVGIEGRDLRTQVALLEDVHGALRDRLSDAEG